MTTIRELQESLSQFDPDAQVIFSKDSEGNSFSPYSGDWTTGLYVADSTWQGDFYDFSETDIYEADQAVNSVVFWPVN